VLYFKVNESGGDEMSESKIQQCSFCDKSKDEVQESNGKLIAGPNDVFICNECVKLCCEILVDSGLDEFSLSQNE